MRRIFIIAGTAALLSGAAFAQSASQNQPDQSKGTPPAATQQNTQGAAQQGGTQGQSALRSVNPTAAVKVTYYTV